MNQSKQIKFLSKSIYSKLYLKGYTLAIEQSEFKAFLERGIRVSEKLVKGTKEYRVYDSIAGTDYYEINNPFLLKLILENV